MLVFRFYLHPNFLSYFFMYDFRYFDIMVHQPHSKHRIYTYLPIIYHYHPFNNSLRLNAIYRKHAFRSYHVASIEIKVCQFNKLTGKRGSFKLFSFQIVLMKKFTLQVTVKSFESLNIDRESEGILR